MVLPDVLSLVAGAAMIPGWTWCDGCRVPVKFSSTPPTKCAKCGGALLSVQIWMEPVKKPKPYKLSENDRRFLASIRISQDVPEEVV